MLIIFLMIILIALFAVWGVFSLYEMGLLFLVNLIIAWLVGLRIIHDFRNKKNIAVYLASLAVSLFLIMFKNITWLDAVSRILSKFMIIGAMQILLLVFFIAQLWLIFSRKHRKK